MMLVLALVGGFGVREIAAAFVSSHAAVEKRLTRAKKTLKESGLLFDIADAADFAATPSGRAARALSYLQRGLSRCVGACGRARRSLPRSDSA